MTAEAVDLDGHAVRIVLSGVRDAGEVCIKNGVNGLLHLVQARAADTQGNEGLDDVGGVDTDVGDSSSARRCAGELSRQTIYNNKSFVGFADSLLVGFASETSKVVETAVHGLQRAGQGRMGHDPDV